MFEVAKFEQELSLCYDSGPSIRIELVDQTSIVYVQETWAVPKWLKRSPTGLENKINKNNCYFKLIVKAELLSNIYIFGGKVQLII